MANPFRLPMLWRSVKNLFSPPATRRYPLETRLRPLRARGRLTIDLPTCNFCGLCVRRCPCEALDVSREDKTFCIEGLRCVSCGACVEACNKDSLKLVGEPMAVQERGGVVERLKREEPG